MKRILPRLAGLLAVSVLALMSTPSISKAAGEGSQSAPAVKPKTKSKLQDDDPSGEAFVAKVKVVRTVQEETEVFFESEKARGSYLLSTTSKDYAVLKNRLQKSQAAGGPDVSVTTDGDKKILTVELQEVKKTADPAPSWDKI